MAETPKAVALAQQLVRAEEQVAHYESGLEYLASSRDKYFYGSFPARNLPGADIPKQVLVKVYRSELAAAEEYRNQVKKELAGGA